MKCKKVTAIIRTHKLGEVEARLKEIGVKGMTTSQVLGFGEETETDFFNPNKLERHLKLEIWTTEEKAQQVANAIIEIAHVGIAGDGMVSISPVDEVFRIRTKHPATDAEV
jgi:nitrogen regulatory protein P-II 1